MIYFIIIVYSSCDIHDLILIFLIFRNHITLLKKGKNKKRNGRVHYSTLCVWLTVLDAYHPYEDTSLYLVTKKTKKSWAYSLKTRRHSSDAKYLTAACRQNKLLFKNYRYGLMTTTPRCKRNCCNSVVFQRDNPLIERGWQSISINGMH